MHYSIVRETAPGTFEPVGLVYECDTPDQAQAYVEKLQASNGGCYGANLVDAPETPAAPEATAGDDPAADLAS